jgi:hypothetical protein
VRILLILILVSALAPECWGSRCVSDLRRPAQLDILVSSSR